MSKKFGIDWDDPDACFVVAFFGVILGSALVAGILIGLITIILTWLE